METKLNFFSFLQKFWNPPRGATKITFYSPRRTAHCSGFSIVYLWISKTKTGIVAGGGKLSNIIYLDFYYIIWYIVKRQFNKFTTALTGALKQCTSTEILKYDPPNVRWCIRIPSANASPVWERSWKSEDGFCYWLYVCGKEYCWGYESCLCAP